MQDKIHSCRFSHIDAYVGIFRHILTYSEIIRHIQELSRDIQAHSEASVTPVYSEFWCIQNPGIFRTSSIFTTLSNIWDREFYENNANSFLHLFSNMVNSEINETGHNKVELVFNILAYSDIIRHFQEWSRDIKAHSEVCVTPVYSEPWYVQNPGILRTSSIFTIQPNICDIAFYKNKVNSFLPYFQI